VSRPLAYHRAFPSVPVPGIACVVFRGRIPGLGVPGRLVVHPERDAVRPAVLMAARLSIADGLLAVRSTTSWTGNAMVGHIDAFCAAAAAVIGESQPSPSATRGTLSV
jgi:hypothetical protein